MHRQWGKPDACWGPASGAQRRGRGFGFAWQARSADDRSAGKPCQRSLVRAPRNQRGARRILCRPVCVKRGFGEFSPPLPQRRVRPIDSPRPTRQSHPLRGRYRHLACPSTSGWPPLQVPEICSQRADFSRFRRFSSLPHHTERAFTCRHFASRADARGPRRRGLLCHRKRKWMALTGRRRRTGWRAIKYAADLTCAADAEKIVGLLGSKRHWRVAASAFPPIGTPRERLLARPSRPTTIGSQPRRFLPYTFSNRWISP